MHSQSAEVRGKRLANNVKNVTRIAAVLMCGIFVGKIAFSQYREALEQVLLLLIFATPLSVCFMLWLNRDLVLRRPDQRADSSTFDDGGSS